MNPQIRHAQRACESAKARIIGVGYQHGLCRASGPVKVWMSLPAAVAVAKRIGGVVTTVPRFNGVCRVWAEVKT